MGPGRIVGDLRFLFDFSQIGVKTGSGTYDLLARRGFVLSTGYAMSF